MGNQLSLWQFVGGIGLFLFAMLQLETALQSFAGRTLKEFLQRHTNNAIKSVSVGAIATALVQSSSMIGLIVLAFAGAGVITLQNALGVIFGANLGTTLTGWIVTTIGFKLDLESASLPLIGIGSLVLVGLKGKVSEVGRFAAAMGLLLLGLSLMKESVGAFSDRLDVDSLANLAAWQYLLFGVVVAAIVQSSSAVMVLTLTALHAGVIELPAAAAVAIGADLGTTSTVMIGALQGAVIKKRVALAHVIFNVTTDTVAFVLLLPLLAVVKALGLTDPLLSLVAFHSLFNFLGIVLFLPFIKPFARFLGRRFEARDPHENLFVGETPSTVPDAALRAISKETAHIIGRVIRHNLRAFTPALPTPPGQMPVAAPAASDDASISYEEGYRRNKKLEGEILSYALMVQAEPLEPDRAKRLSRLLSSVRHAVHSSKSLRDIRHNFDEIADSPRPDVYDYLDHFRSVMGEFYASIYRLRTAAIAKATIRDFAEMNDRAQLVHDHLHQQIYADIQSSQIGDNEISSL
ncbi:MAG: Na/Pi symporter, partial [Gammaproteobacteria bacterium]|nr:Na/Pi symporter [Gammaproteobacteria bacterium]